MNQFRNILLLLVGLKLSLGATAQTIVIRRFKESYYLKPLHMEKSLYYYPPFDGRSMFIKVKSKKP